MRLRLTVGEVAREAHFASEDVELDPSPDAAFVAGLPVAMGMASSLECPAGVSARLLANSGTIQDLLSAWTPPWGPALRPLEVRAKPSASTAAGRRGTAAFLTCGVDSFYTVLRRREEIDAVVYVHGLDLSPEDSKRGLIRSNFRQVAAELGLPAIELSTDVRAAFSDEVCDWERIYTSAALATIGHLLSARFERVLIPASHAYRDLHPTGSHPLLDPLWSGDRLRVEHVDALTRVEKLAYLVDSPLAMSSLRVCFRPPTDGLNCGVCAKCTRTKVNLRVIGALGRCETLPGGISLREMSGGKIRTRRSLTYVKENLAAVEARGTDPNLELALRRLVARGSRTESWQKSVLLARSARVVARAQAGAFARRIGLR